MMILYHFLFRFATQILILFPLIVKFHSTAPTLNQAIHTILIRMDLYQCHHVVSGSPHPLHLHHKDHA